MNKKLKYNQFYIFAIVFLQTFLIALTIESSFGFEIKKNGDLSALVLETEDIVKVGIKEHDEESTIDIFLSSDCHSKLFELTKENVGKKINVISNDTILFSVRVNEPIENGEISITFPSNKKDAKQIVKNMGKEPDYYTIVDNNDSSSHPYIKSANNTWVIKCLNAQSKGDYKMAEEYAKKAISSNPNDPILYEIIASIKFMQGEINLAIDQYLKARAIIKDEEIYKYPGTFNSLGELYLKLGDYDNSIKYYHELLKADNSNLTAHLGVAKVYEKMGNFEYAIKEYTFLSKSGDKYIKDAGIKGVERLKGK